MQSFSEEIDRLEQSVCALIDLHKQDREAVAKLRQVNANLRSELEMQKKQIIALTEQCKMIKLAKSFADTGETSTDIKLKINAMVREVDRCIAMLNK